MSLQIFQKSRSHHKILRLRMVNWSNFHTGNPQILGAILQNSVALATKFVHPCPKVLAYFIRVRSPILENATTNTSCNHEKIKSISN